MNYLCQIKELSHDYLLVIKTEGQYWATNLVPLFEVTLLQQLPAWKWRPARYVTWCMLREMKCRDKNTAEQCVNQLQLQFQLHAGKCLDWITSVGTLLLDQMQIKWTQKHGELNYKQHMAHKNSGRKKLPFAFSSYFISAGGYVVGAGQGNVKLELWPCSKACVFFN